MFHVEHPGQMRMRIILIWQAKKYPLEAGRFLARFVLGHKPLGDEEVERASPDYDIRDDAIRQIYRSENFHHFVMPP